MKLAGGTDVRNTIAQCSDTTEVARALYISHIYIYTQSSHLCFSHPSEIAPCSPLMREVGEVEKWPKRDREMRERVRVDLWVSMKRAL